MSAVELAGILAGLTLACALALVASRMPWDAEESDRTDEELGL